MGLGEQGGKHLDVTEVGKGELGSIAAAAWQDGDGDGVELERW